MQKERQVRSNVKIKNGYTKTKGQKTRFIIPLEKDGEKFFDLYYEVDTEYDKFLVTERADAALLAIIERCMKNSWNITSEPPISEDLLYQVETYVIPFFAKNWDDMHFIKIIVDGINDPIQSMKKVGTGFSAGVDSFYSILKHMDPPYENHKITHLFLMQNGASGSNIGGKKGNDWMEKSVGFLKPYAKRLGLPFISVFSNVADFYKDDKCFNGDVVVSMSFIHLMRKMIGVYYWGSGYEFPDIRLNTDDTGNWDQLLINYLSVDGLHIYESGLEVSRQEKVEYIADNHLAQKALSVCGVELRNCGRCAKCLRTMSELYIIDKLDDFAESFPVNDFKDNIVNRLAEEVVVDQKEYVKIIMDRIWKKDKSLYRRVRARSIIYKILWFFRLRLKKVKLIKWIYLRLNIDIALNGRKSDLRNE